MSAIESDIVMLKTLLCQKCTIYILMPSVYQATHYLVQQEDSLG